MSPKVLRMASSVLCLLAVAISAQAGPITIRTARQDNNTFKFDPQNAALPGICIEIIRAVEKADPEIKFSGLDGSLPLPRIQSEMVDGKLDAFCGLLKTTERQAQVNFMDVVLYSVRHKVAVRADDTVSVKSFDDIRKLGTNNTIVTTQGQAYVVFLRNQGGLTIDDGSKDNAANLQKLLQERARFFYQAESTLLEYIGNEKLQSKVKILPAVFKEESQYFVVSKLMPPANVEKLHAALEKVSKSGEMGKIFARYSAH